MAESVFSVKLYIFSPNVQSFSTFCDVCEIHRKYSELLKNSEKYSFL